MSAALTPVSTLPPNRRDRRTARTRQAIIDAARALIDEQGYTHTTIDQIAERADIAARTFFRHFPSKEAVLFAEFEESRKTMLDLIRAQPTDDQPLRAVLDGLAEFCEVIAADRERYTWAFQVMEQHDLRYEQSVLKAETAAHIAEYLAERLDADPTTDLRPQTWALIALTLFGHAMQGAFGTCGTGEPRSRFESLLAETGACFEQVIAERAR